MKLETTMKRSAAIAAVLALGLAGCSSSDSGSADSAGGAKGAMPKPRVNCDVPKENLDGKKVDTSKAKGEITFMTQNLKKDFSPFFEKIIAKFEKENPGTKIIWQDKPGGKDFDKLMVADAVQCHMADVVNVPQQTVLTLARPNLLLNLDTKAPGIGDKFVADLWNAAAVGHDKAHVALPWYSSGAITSYNKEVFKRNGLDPEKPPKTMEEVFAMGHKIARAGTKDYAVYGNANWYLPSQLIGMGVKLMNEDNTKFTFAKDPNAIKWVKEMASLYKEGVIPKDSLTGSPDPNKAYFQGNLAIGTPNPSFLRAVRKNNPKVYEVTGVGPYPTNPGIKQSVGAQYIAVSVTTKNTPLAVKFAEFMTNAESEYAWAHDGGAIIFPPAKEALEKIGKNPPEFASDPVFKAAYNVAADGVKSGKFYPSLLYISGNVQKAMVDNINKGVRGEMTPEGSLKAAQDEMNKYLDRANKK